MGFFDDLVKSVVKDGLDLIPGGKTVYTIAKALTGALTDDDAKAKIDADPALQIELQTRVMAHNLEMAKIKLQEKELEVEQANNEAGNLREETAELNRRSEALEGTAADLKAMPILGPIMLFLRGSQRPVWGFLTAYFDLMVMAGSWTLNDRQGVMLTVVNVLVLGFLFGERAVKNLMPLIERVFAVKAGL